MKYKRGWLKIAEAVIAIMLVTSVLLLAHSRTKERPDISDYVYDLQSKILSDISSDKVLRESVLGYNGGEIPSNITEFVRINLPTNFNFSVAICDVGKPCRVDVVEKNVYVEETIISSTLQQYAPKKVKLYVWEIE